MLDLTEILVLDTDIVLRGVGNKYWALNSKNGNQYQLNEVSYFMLEVFRKPTDIKTLIDVMLSEYKVERKRLEADCDTFIDYATHKNILKKEVQL